MNDEWGAGGVTWHLEVTKQTLSEVQVMHDVVSHSHCCFLSRVLKPFNFYRILVRPFSSLLELNS